MSNFFSKNLKWIREEKGLNQIEVATALGLKRGTYANYEYGNTEPTIDTIAKFVAFYNINVHDMLFSDLSKGNLIQKTGGQENAQKGNLKGNPMGNLIDEKGKVKGKLIGKVNEEGTSFSVPKILNDLTGKVYDWVNKPLKLLYKVGENDFYEIKAELPVISLPYLGDQDTFVRLQIKGDSMSPTIKDGNYVVARYLPEPAPILREGNVYCYVNDQDGLQCKRIYKGPETEIYYLQSDNQVYKTYSRKLSDISALFEVIEVHSTDLSNNSQEVTRLWNAIEDLRLKLDRESK